MIHERLHIQPFSFLINLQVKQPELMKKVLFILILAVLQFSGCRTAKTATMADAVKDKEKSEPVLATESENEIDFHDASTWILGDFLPEKLRYSDHSSWFISGYNEYSPAQAAMDELVIGDQEGLKITIVLGTWCPDSRREVPRFMKIIDLWGFPVSKIRFIGVDMNKIAPLDDYQQLGIARVPTFIFYKNNIEKGRIIEVPVTSLEQDMVNILRR